MSKYIAVIPRAAITRAALVDAGGRSMEQVKAACGCQYIINSWFYDTGTGRPVGNLKIGGAVKVDAGWNGWGLTWDKGADIRLDIVPDNGGASYLSGVELLTPTRGPGKAISYSPEYGGTRGRSAVLLAGARVILYCSGDGTRDAKTPEALRDELVTRAWAWDFPTKAGQSWLSTTERLSYTALPPISDRDAPLYSYRWFPRQPALERN